MVIMVNEPEVTVVLPEPLAKDVTKATATDFGDDAESGVGNLRLDYVIPSRACLETGRSGVVWPAPGHPHYGLVGPGYPIESSDHRMIWRDVRWGKD